MSYTIDEGIQDLQRKLAATKDICAVYPNARISHDGRWVSEEVPLEKCENFDFIVSEDSNRNKDVIFRFYQSIGENGGRIYRDWGGSVNLTLFLQRLFGVNPKLHAALLKELKSQCAY